MSLSAPRVQSPCSADWYAMSGDGDRRFCLQCHKTVHDLSAMAPCEAEKLLADAKATRTPICVRFLQGPAGRVLFRASMGAGAALLAGCAPKVLEPLMGDVAVDTGDRPMMGKISGPLEEPSGPEPVATPADVVQGGVEAPRDADPAPTDAGPAPTEAGPPGVPSRE